MENATKLVFTNIWFDQVEITKIELYIQPHPKHRFFLTLNTTPFEIALRLLRRFNFARKLLSFAFIIVFFLF